MDTFIYLLTCLHYYFKNYSSLALGLSLVFRWVWGGIVCLVTSVESDSLHPMDHGLPGSSVHGILQARILEWIAISFSSDKVGSEWSEVTQSCLTLCNPMDCSLQGSSVHGIFQARVLEWGAISFSRWGLKLLQKDMSTSCLLRNLYAGQEATVRTGHGKTDWFQIGKGVSQGCILSPCLFNLYAEYIMRNAGLEEAQAAIKISRRNIMQMTPPLWQKVKRN